MLMVATTSCYAASAALLAQSEQQASRPGGSLHDDRVSTNDATINNGVSCSEQLGELVPCIDAIQSPVLPPIPSDLCCFGVQTVDSSCICDALAKLLAEGPPSNWNIPSALLLPTQCGVVVGPNTTCAGYPVPPTPGES
ncbi:unnamed protein product [Calypogeia fissa]